MYYTATFKVLNYIILLSGIKNLRKPNLIIPDCGNLAGKIDKYQHFKSCKTLTSLPQFFNDELKRRST
jgi:hypothetical protein